MKKGNWFIPAALILLLTGCIAGEKTMENTKQELYAEEARESFTSPTPSESARMNTNPGGAVLSGDDSDTEIIEAVYLGVKGYGTVNKSSMPAFRYRFFADGEELLCTIDNGPRAEDGILSYPIQNILKEGYVYRLRIENGTVLYAEEVVFSHSGTIEAVTDGGFIASGTEYPIRSIWSLTGQAGGATVGEIPPQIGDIVFISEDGSGRRAYRIPAIKAYTPPVSGIPGRKTLKNFLATALTPVGTTLYIYGGAWDWQDTGSSVQATEIGLPDEWVSFFQMQDAGYTYKASDPALSYYPFGGWNEYYFAGADCSGYVGWVLYNTMHDRDGEAGYVVYAADYAKGLSERGWGSYSKSVAVPNGSAETAIKPGDIMSMSGHVWISLGTCSDGSVVIAHSTPSASRGGQPGGGVQLSAIGRSKTCEAYGLAKEYMTRYYPAWSERYAVVLRRPSEYLTATGNGTGLFSWDVSDGANGLSDPEGYQNMTPREILSNLFDAAPK